jgi:acetoin utilization deacetylase AcuC-like enzyme
MRCCCRLLHCLPQVLLLDFDVHHGNGSEDMFWESRQVLYVSTHQAGLWPYTGKLTSTGGGEWGRGYTINVPLPGDAGHASVLAVWDAVIEPAARRFRPDIVLVSLGFDAHVLDPLASLQFREATYHALCQRTAQLARELCGGRCVWVLEGGYHEASLSASVVSSFLGALGVEEASAGEAAAWLRPEPEDKVNAVIQAVQRMHGL